MADRKGGKNGEVGYGRPPKKTQFKKGKSGNSKGRPPKPQSSADEHILDEFFRLGMEEIEVTDKAGRTQKMRRRTPSLLRLYSDGATSAKGAVIVIDLHRTQPLKPSTEKTEMLLEDEAILARAIKSFANDNGGGEVGTDEGETNTAVEDDESGAS